MLNSVSLCHASPGFQLLFGPPANQFYLCISQTPKLNTFHTKLITLIPVSAPLPVLSVSVGGTAIHQVTQTRNTDIILNFFHLPYSPHLQVLTIFNPNYNLKSLFPSSRTAPVHSHCAAVTASTLPLPAHGTSVFFPVSSRINLKQKLKKNKTKKKLANPIPCSSSLTN